MPKTKLLHRDEKNVYVVKNEAGNNDDFVLFLLLCHDIERLEDTASRLHDTSDN